MNERKGFEEALIANPDDNVTRLIFADWLDENNEPEESERMRRWQASKEWMLNWVRSINYSKWEYDEEGESVKDASGHRIPATKDNLGDPHTLEHAIEAGHAAVSGKTYCWGSDDGSSFFYQRGREIKEWWFHWSTLTGITPKNEEYLIENPPFSCAC